jgi:CheY-like chemotaxis protein
MEILKARKVNVLVLDVMMPFERMEDLIAQGEEAVRAAPKKDVWTGIRFYRLVREQFPNLRIVCLSALDEEEIRAQAPDVKFDCPLLHKGGDTFDVVYSTIRDALLPSAR